MTEFTNSQSYETELVNDSPQDYAHNQGIIDIDVQDPRIQRKSIMDKYVILNYSGTNLVDNPNHYYSVIADAVSKQVYSIAPSMPMPIEDFIQRFPLCTEHIQITQMSEGTLIQLFYDKTEKEWQIATRGNIGGNNSHYRTEYPGFVFQQQKTFREMFYDALTQVTVAPQIISDSNPDKTLCNLTYNAQETYYNTPLSSIPYVKTLDKSCCYSYVIAHPSNPLTNVVFIPTITLVAVSEIMPYGANTGKYQAVTIPQHIFAEMIPPEYRQIVRLQPSINWCGKSLYEETMNYMFINDSYPGLMFTHLITGERAVLENMSYNAVAQLRGNHKNLQYQFFELYCSKRVVEFLTRFPRFSGLFTYFFNQYYDFTFRVYSIYVQYYIHKNREPVDYTYHKHASKIHRDIYLASVATGQTTKITREIVQNYFDAMTPSQLLYIITTTTSVRTP